MRFDDVFADKLRVTINRTRADFSILRTGIFYANPIIEKSEEKQKSNTENDEYYRKGRMNMELDPVQKPEFYPFIESIPNVIECNCVTGNYSMLMKVAFPSTIELDGFIGQLQHFGKTQTQIVFSTPAAGFYLVSFLIDQADITVLQCSMPAAGEA